MKRLEPIFNLKFQETYGSYNSCSKGLKDKFVGRPGMLCKTPDLFLSNSSRINLFPQYPVERLVLNFFLSLKVFESELPTTTVGETWHRFFR